MRPLFGPPHPQTRVTQGGTVTAYGAHWEQPWLEAAKNTTSMNLSLSAPSMAIEGSITVSFDIVNTGSVAGAEVAELYVHDVVASVPRPPKELKGFAKVRLEPAERKRLEICLDRRAFEYYDADGHEWVVEAGQFEILVGTSCSSGRTRTGTGARCCGHRCGDTR